MFQKKAYSFFHPTKLVWYWRFLEGKHEDLSIEMDNLIIYLLCLVSDLFQNLFVFSLSSPLKKRWLFLS